jgi:hypothetical protein
MAMLRNKPIYRNGQIVSYYTGDESGYEAQARAMGGTTTPGGGAAPSAPTNTNAGRTPVTLGNGQTVYYDRSGQAYDASGNPVSNTTVAASKAGAAPPPSANVPPTANVTNNNNAATSFVNDPTNADLKRQLDDMYSQAGISQSPLAYAADLQALKSGKSISEIAGRYGVQYTPNAQPGPQAPDANAQTDQEFETWLTGLGVADDQKQAIRAVYDAISTNDADRAKRVEAAMKAATEFSDPYFKAQTRLVMDALQRGLSDREGDLAYEVDSRQRVLKELKDDIAASKDYLSFQNRQELETLKRKFEQDLDATRDNLAASGFTTSSKRVKTEQILTDTYGAAVESSNRQLSYQTGRLNRQGANADINTAAEVERLRHLAESGKLSDIRSAEEKVGSSALSGLGYPTLGGVGGSIERDKVRDATSFASNFIF